jgi:hypothetical protein
MLINYQIYLESHLSENGLEIRPRREKWDFHHATSSEAGSKVGRAGEDPAKMVGAHEVGVVLLEHLLDLRGAKREAADDSLDHFC